MKRKICLFLAAVLLAGNLLVLPARAEDDQTSESTATTATEGSRPTDPSTPDPDPTTKPTEGSTDSTTAPADPKPCTHVFGDWTADEAAHGRKCTLCGHAESNAHSWAAEIITVDPTCGEAGGKCKVCTVCAGVLVTELIEPTGKHTYDNSCDTKCNVCGAERTVEHTFGTGWKYNGKGHWHYCTICGAAGEVLDHYPGPAATEDKEQICLTCGMVMMKKKDHTHKWDNQWSSDETGHWYVCSGCSERKDAADHTFDDGCDADCNACGYVRSTAHEYDGWHSDETGHWQICAVCQEESDHETHDLKPDAAKPELAACSICQYTEEHIHEYDPQWKQDEIGHWQECDCGERAEEAEHIWDEGVEEKKMITYTCEICDAQKQEEAPQKSFPWLMVAAGGGILICLTGIVICIILIRKNREDYE